MRALAALTRPMVECECCCGSGKAPLSETLWSTLRVVVGLGKATAAQIAGLSPDRVAHTAMNNRLEHLRDLGLVERQKSGREWLYYSVPGNPALPIVPSSFVGPCISLHRPWALWVREGWKTIETRTHERFRGLDGKQIAIHASQKWEADVAERAYAQGWLTSGQFEQTLQWQAADAMRGQVVALATVNGAGWLSSQASHERKALIECRTARFGLYLRDIVPVNGPQIRGYQGSFTVVFSTNPEL